ncbi:hypothetical protein F5Y03DRAFT_409466 [Xylaria venustula]|nr:hypothetical protein F5Y03DRAFT_409466 [Xylaria venustula]
MAALLNFWNSPNKPSKRASVNGGTPDARGTKRKAKADPYDDMDDDDDDVIPARKTPTSQRTARSRLSSATPGSSSRPRSSLPGPDSGVKRRRGRPSLKSKQQDGASDTPAAAPQKPSIQSNPAQVQAVDVAPVPSDTLVPEAPMGGLELLGNNAAAAPAPSASKPRTELINEPPPKQKETAKPTEAKSIQQSRGEKEEVKDQAQAEDNRQELEIAKLVNHRMAGDGSGAVELLVQWVGEGEEDASWEVEEEIQQSAEEVLYDYWNAQGGRVNALFIKPKNPPQTQTYHVFKILRHQRKNRGGFEFEVQWVGHSAERGETTFESEPKLKNIAPELLHQYWESVGGRASHLAPRGRAKKVRTK